MYTGSAARIYNPRPDPAERGPPKRVAREESHIGEMVAASKKRISWKFTLGESDVTHEVVLVHSIMSYKKVRLCMCTCVHAHVCACVCSQSRS